MKELRDRVLIPLAIPLAAGVVIVIIVLNFSRILLAVEERGSETLATMLAIIVASSVLFFASWFSARGEERSGRNVSALVSAGMVLVLAGVVGAEAIEEERKHEAEAGENELGEPELIVAAGPGLTFPEKQLQTHSGKVVVEYRNDDTAAHTLVFEGLPGFKLEVPSKGAKVKGEAEFEPKSYVYYCDIPGHRQAGMEGTLTVTEGGGGAGGQAAADIVAKAPLRFEPPEVAVPAGPVKVTLKNEDTQLHTLVVEDQPLFKKLEATGGESQTGTLEVGPGTYTLYCDVPGHRAAGMHTTLKVG